MVRCRRVSLLAVVTCILWVPAVFSQSTSRGSTMRSIQQQSQSSGNHGLVLVLSRDTAPEPPQSSDLKDCLAHHPPLACVPLYLTITNEGKESILGWFPDCNDSEYFDVNFYLLMPDGEWAFLPRTFDPPSQIDAPNLPSPMCGRSVVRGFWPQQSDNERLRLADLFPWLDTSAPPPSEMASRERQKKAYALLVGGGPHTIRAHRLVHGCSASDKVRSASDLGKFPNMSERESKRLLCDGGEQLKPIIDLQSNELKLELLRSASQ
jgi:hypothetical protein